MFVALENRNTDHDLVCLSGQSLKPPSTHIDFNSHSARLRLCCSTPAASRGTKHACLRALKRIPELTSCVEDNGKPATMTGNMVNKQPAQLNETQPHVPVQYSGAASPHSRIFVRTTDTRQGNEQGKNIIQDPGTTAPPTNKKQPPKMNEESGRNEEKNNTADKNQETTDKTQGTTRRTQKSKQ